MMRRRGGLDCLHEPFGEAWYQCEEPFWQRFKEGDKITPGPTLGTVWNDIKKRAEQGPIFIKDFPHYINHIWDAEFLSHFAHTFQIRDQKKKITSVYDKWPYFHEGGVGFSEKRALFDLVTALHDKTPPPVVDINNLLENPYIIFKALRGTVEIKFAPDALNWEMGADTRQYIWWDCRSFHESLKNSTGLMPHVRKYVDLNNAPKRMALHYAHVCQHKIKA